MLWQEVREKRGWCYQIDSEITTLSDTGALQIYAGVDAANTQRAVDLIWRQMQRLAAKPVSAKTLARAKAYACGAGLLALEGSSHLMLWMGESLLCYGKLSTVAQAQQRLQSITAEEVWRLAREIFQPDRCALVTVGPVAAASFIPG
jgi:predicted Zn-dependent peptidase